MSDKCIRVHFQAILHVHFIALCTTVLDVSSRSS